MPVRIGTPSPVSSPTIGLYAAPPGNVTLGRSAWRMTVSASGIGSSSHLIVRIVSALLSVYRPERRHHQYAGTVEDRLEALQKRLHRLQRALDRARAHNAVLAIAVFARDPLVEQLGETLFSWKYGERDRRLRGNVGGLFGETQRDRIAAELIDEPARLGLLAGPHPTLRDRLDLLLGHVTAGRDVVFEASVRLVEKGFEAGAPALGKILGGAEHRCIGADL